LRWAPVRGQRRAFHITAEPLDGGGSGAIAIDVTETETLRQAFERHVSAHDETLNHLADAVAIFSPAKRLQFHNRAFAELWGLEDAWLGERPSHSEVLDRLRQRRRLPETSDYAGWKAHELAFYEALEAPPDELWSVPGGRTLRVVRQPHPLGGLLLLFSDITDELKLKAQYNAVVGVQKATLDKLGDAVAVFGADGRLRLHNEAFEGFWRIPAGALPETEHFDAVVDLCQPYLHDMQFWRDLKARVADPDPQARSPVVGEVRGADGRYIGFQTRPLPDGATLLAFNDVTATRELERALAERSTALSEAERLKRDFVGNVSYELRTPLTTIIGYSELLDRQGEALPDRARGHVASVRQAANQLAASIDDVLDMAAVDAGELALQVGEVPVAHLLEGAAERVARAASEGGVTVRVEADPESVIRADEKRLGQVLDHLVTNAVRTTPAGGVVTLSAKRAFGELQIKVQDNGRGIPFAVQAHIFDRFVSRDRGGPGLGLALVKAIVELHGGWVALESEPGKGATFTCHLPERAYAPAAVQRQAAYA
jgi:signal transduction histidine kinase